MELKKSYKGLVLWMLGYLAALAIPFVVQSDAALCMRLILHITSLGMALLCWIVLKTEAVYWYNGTTYEEAVQAGSQRRKAFARKHFDAFFRFALLFLLFSVGMALLNISFWADFAVGSIGLIAVAISTIRFKL